jgi:hypothetical protein
MSRLLLSSLLHASEVKHISLDRARQLAREYVTQIETDATRCSTVTLENFNEEPAAQYIARAAVRSVKKIAFSVDPHQVEFQHFDPVFTASKGGICPNMVGAGDSLFVPTVINSFYMFYCKREALVVSVITYRGQLNGESVCRRELSYQPLESVDEL